MTADRVRNVVGIALAALLIVACQSAQDESTDPGDGATSSTTRAPASNENPTDRPEDVSDPAAPPGAEAAGPACASFRELVVPDVPCERLVTAIGETSCHRLDGEVIDCSEVPSPARIGQSAGLVLGGQPARPEVEAVQLGQGPGPTNTVLVMFTGAPLPQPTGDRLELAVVYDDPATSCDAPGEAWHRGAFASVLALGPDEVVVTDLGCRPDGFSAIVQRSSWLIAGDRVVVYLPIDLPGTPSRLVGAFRPAPGFANVDARLATRELDSAAWNFDDPLRP